MSNTHQSAGMLLRHWRQRRRLSQLELASEAGISQRHLSFVESGRSAPSRDMVLHLAEQLEVPLRERNTLLMAAGFAPIYRERTFDDPELEAARGAVDLILKAQEPYPALAVDRHWTLVSMNRAVPHLLDGVSPKLLKPPVNVLRLSLSPDGLAPRLVNFREWRAHVLARLARQIDSSPDPALLNLLEELKGYPVPRSSMPGRQNAGGKYGGIVVPLKLSAKEGVLSFFSTTTVFGTPLDITLSELAIESFFPADAETADAMRRLALAEAAE